MSQSNTYQWIFLTLNIILLARPLCQQLGKSPYVHVETNLMALVELIREDQGGKTKRTSLEGKIRPKKLPSVVSTVGCAEVMSHIPVYSHSLSEPNKRNVSR